MTRRIEGILFDLGDTLLNFGRVDVNAMFEEGARRAYTFLKDSGHPVPPFRTFHRRQYWWVRWSYLVSFLTRREFSSLQLIERLSVGMGQKLNNGELEELAWLWYEPLSEIATVDPGTQEMLASFRDEGMTLGVVSNTFIPACVLDRHLALHGMLELLPHRIYSCDVGFRKPDPRIFRAALDRTGLRADRTLFVGDLPRADVRGASRAGLIPVLKDPNGTFHRVADQAAHSIRQLGELQGIVASYDGREN